ncbi:MAG: Tfp pilus assembly protein FimT/FimU, partial [Alphaproteobacteria bacterium]
MNIKIKDLFKRNPGVISLKRHTKQSGRTMTEMLGVLAIIGIISITALKGFEYAMERYRENETLNRFAKVVAGARTGRLLENYGLDTVVCTDRSDETGCTRGDD